MTSPKVYLAGPITGLTYGDADSWRQLAIERLRPVRGFDPLRGKAYLDKIKGGLSGTGEEYKDMGVLVRQKSVMTRDHYDVISADALLVNVLGAKVVSLGTVMEVAWAWDRHIPVVCVIEDDGSNPHEHMMWREALGFRVPTLEEGIELVKNVLLGPDYVPTDEQIGRYIRRLGDVPGAVWSGP